MAMSCVGVDVAGPALLPRLPLLARGFRCVCVGVWGGDGGTLRSPSLLVCFNALKCHASRAGLENLQGIKASRDFRGLLSLLPSALWSRQTQRLFSSCFPTIPPQAATAPQQQGCSWLPPWLLRGSEDPSDTTQSCWNARMEVGTRASADGDAGDHNKTDRLITTYVPKMPLQPGIEDPDQRRGSRDESRSWGSPWSASLGLST